MVIVVVLANNINVKEVVTKMDKTPQHLMAMTLMIYHEVIYFLFISLLCFILLSLLVLYIMFLTITLTIMCFYLLVSLGGGDIDMGAK